MVLYKMKLQFIHKTYQIYKTNKIYNKISNYVILQRMSTINVMMNNNNKFRQNKIGIKSRIEINVLNINIELKKNQMKFNKIFNPMILIVIYQVIDLLIICLVLTTFMIVI